MDQPQPPAAPAAPPAPPAPPPRPFPWRVFCWALALTFAAAAGVYLADRLYYAPLREQRRHVEELERQKQELERRKKELEQIVERFKRVERRAQIVVLDQQASSDGIPTTRFRFTEIDAEGNPRSAGREFTLTGEEVYFDMLVIKFDDKFIEEGDALRGQALTLFRRTFTNRMKPEEGPALDARGVAPDVYAAKHAPSAFERELWARFWELADNPKEAQKRGVRVLQGEALYRRLEKDRMYLIEQRATGELSLAPVQLKRQ